MITNSNVKKVSIIIPTLNRSNVVLNTIKDLMNQRYLNYEIIVVDQTERPKKELLNYINKNKKTIKYIQIKRKSSPHARNIGAKYASGDIILFLDDDVQIKDINFIKYHIDNYNDKKTGLVGGRVVTDFNKTNNTFKEVGKLKYFGLKEITHFDSCKKTKIDHAAGGNFSCYKDLYQKVGGFCELYIGNAHMEETDFCLRVKKTGYNLIFEPKAVLRHLQYGSGGNRTKDIYEFRYWLVRNCTLFYLKNQPKIMFPVFFIKEMFWAITTSIKRFDFKMFKTMIKALFNGIKYYKTSENKL